MGGMFLLGDDGGGGGGGGKFLTTTDGDGDVRQWTHPALLAGKYLESIQYP